MGGIVSTYSFLPLAGALFVIMLGFFVWLKKARNLLQILFFFYCLAVALWLFGTFKMFNARFDAAAVFWDRIIYIGVVFIPIFLFHFGLVYCRVRNQRAVLVIGYLLAFFFLPLSQTDLFVKDLFRYSWGVHTRAQILHLPFLIYFFVYFISFFVNLFFYYRRSQGALKREIKYILIGFAILDVIGPLAFLPAYGVSVYPVIFLSAVPFALLLAYAVIRHNALDLKVISVEVFASLIIFIFLIELFFVRYTWELILRSAALLLLVIFAFLFTQATKREIRRREEVQKLAAKLKSANEKLVELDQAKSQFLSIAAHQLRTPLSIIKGYISMIQEGDYGPLDNLRIADVLNKTYQSNEHLIHLVDDFLDVARIEAGRIEYDFAATDLGALVAETVNEIKLRIGEKGLNLELKIEKDLPLVKADAAKLRHVIFNFLDNAVKYTDRGGIKVTLRRQKNELVCEVADTGVGMGKSDQKNIFQKFYRGRNVKDREVKGVGLGLFVCHQLIEAHQGRLWGKSAGLGRGSNFGFSLPLGQNRRR